MAADDEKAKPAPRPEKWNYKEGDLNFPPCAYCAYKALGGTNCQAYPNGIPAYYLDGTLYHMVSAIGDGGIVFFPRVAFEQLPKPIRDSYAAIHNLQLPPDDTGEER